MAGVKGRTGKYKKSKEHNAALSKALKGRKFTEEHFAYYPELRFAIDNGRTLCVSCHKMKDDKRTI